jgi:hypothetical protein
MSSTAAIAEKESTMRGSLLVPLALAAILAAPVAHAADWQALAKDDDGNVYSLDRQSVRSDRGEASGVVRNEYAAPRPDAASGKQGFAALDRLLVNCETASFALQSRTLVLADGTERTSLSATREQLTFRAAAAGSMSETIVRGLCRAAKGE